MSTVSNLTFIIFLYFYYTALHKWFKYGNWTSSVKATRFLEVFLVQLLSSCDIKKVFLIICICVPACIEAYCFSFFRYTNKTVAKLSFLFFLSCVAYSLKQCVR